MSQPVSQPMPRHILLRIAREITEIQNGPNMFLEQESDLRSVRALIIGPPDTPYENGFFEFCVSFDTSYPSRPPKVGALTTNGGRTRFNPNIYAYGKVCLSILGTWPGGSCDQWSSALGLESVLLSIQSLMSSNPYANEPGFQDSKGESDAVIRKSYCDKIRHETLRVTVIEKLELILGLKIPKSSNSTKSDKPSGLTLFNVKVELPTSHNCETAELHPFFDLQKIRFLWYYESYQTAIKEGSRTPGEKVAFARMPFESNRNGMFGHFQYAFLEKRLRNIREALEKETTQWAEEGQKAVNQDLCIAYSVRRQFTQFCAYQKEENLHNIEVSLVDDNPFVWMIVYFGRCGSNLDGGVFRIRLSLSPRFPKEQPRVYLQNQMYHHRVSNDGVLCYLPPRKDEIKYHVQAIVKAIEEESPPFDPMRVVNAEAARLFWGTPDEKKRYNRAQRRSAEASLEEQSS